LNVTQLAELSKLSKAYISQVKHGKRSPSQKLLDTLASLERPKKPDKDYINLFLQSRQARGAKERDIWGQFLIEVAFLTFTGGIIGVIVGWAVSYFISSTGLMTTVVSTDIVILAVSVSVGIGLFFGFYPAWNASRLNPIEALRSE